MTFLPYPQDRYPLATLVIVACERPSDQRARVLAVAERESRKRAELFGIPGF